MAKFVLFETGNGTRYINPDRVQQVGEFHSSDEYQKAYLFFEKGDGLVVFGSAQEVAEKLSA
jgi:hypothetical protein